LGGEPLSQFGCSFGAGDVSDVGRANHHVRHQENEQGDSEERQAARREIGFQQRPSHHEGVEQ